LILLTTDFTDSEKPHISHKTKGSRHPEATPEISQIDDLNGRMSKKNEIVSPSTALRVVEKRDCRARLRLARNDIG